MELLRLVVRESIDRLANGIVSIVTSFPNQLVDSRFQLTRLPDSIDQLYSPLPKKGAEGIKLFCCLLGEAFRLVSAHKVLRENLKIILAQLLVIVFPLFDH